MLHTNWTILILLSSIILVGCSDYQPKQDVFRPRGNGLEGVSNFNVDVWVMDTRSNIYLSEDSLESFAHESLKRWGIIDNSKESIGYLRITVTPFRNAAAFTLSFKDQVPNVV
jgi:hypothetical protein